MLEKLIDALKYEPRPKPVRVRVFGPNGVVAVAYLQSGDNQAALDFAFPVGGPITGITIERVKESGREGEE